MAELVYPPVISAFKALWKGLDIQFKFEGQENLPRKGGAVLASNHISYLDFAFIGTGALHLKRYIRFMAKKGAFNDQHDINIFGHAVEVYVQRSDEKHISNGIYSVYDNNWIKFPKKIVANPDTTNIQDKYEHLHAEIDQAIETLEKIMIKFNTRKINKYVNRKIPLVLNLLIVYLTK